MANRTIIVGDVHGCIRELDLLIQKVGYDIEDDWGFVGDLVGKGESSREVLDRVIEMNAKSVVGNHELKWLDFHHRGDASRMKPMDHKSALGLEPKHWEFMANMTPWIELKDDNMIVVHGGFLPSIPWREQTLDQVTTIQVIDEHGVGHMKKNCPKGTPWGDLWNGPEFVAYGHTPNREVRMHPHAMGLDTGCVHGGMLTAWVLPERKIVQVPAQRVYHQANF